MTRIMKLFLRERERERETDTERDFVALDQNLARSTQTRIGCEISDSV